MQTTITQLTIYPVKSLGYINVNEAICLPTGLQYDREWVVVDDKMRFVTQRQIPQMANIKLSLTATHLQFDYLDHTPLLIELAPKPDDAPTCEVQVWKDLCLGVNEGKAASDWLTTILGRNNNEQLHLVRFAQARRRTVREKYSDNEAGHLMFADACPFLIVNEASLAALNEALQAQALTPVPIDRFRGNIQITDAPAWEEYACKQMQVVQEANSKTTTLVLRADAPCHRCPMTGIDQQTGLTPEKGEPFGTLMRLPIPENKTGAYFGMHATFEAIVELDKTSQQKMYFDGNQQPPKQVLLKVGEKLEFSY